ncbi:integrin beta-6-like [Mya arenaria]|uniref:integrin beta-6-like n=1 Tax=Mya arenaria TaxID=6604 RepID=UPI0022E844E9|nr:integrin beta-6-like [Mya arenaria]
MECNGHGTCKCGKCECEPDYEGPTCGECPKCERCSKCRYRECVKCIVENEKQTAMINETAIPFVCQSSCPNLLVTMVNKFNDSDPCVFIESKKCIRNYLVECSNDTVRLNIANHRDHGQCNCGRCLCKDDYDGHHCECPPKRNCKHPETGMECNGHGTCKCGKCECEPDYEGPTCGECPKCERCSKCRYRECVKCIVEDEKQTAMINETAIPLGCQSSCPNLLVTMVNKFNDSDPCGFIVSKECILNYLVECSNDTVRLNIANQRVCTYPANPLLIVLPILACILGVGLLMIIIWRILTSSTTRSNIRGLNMRHSTAY